MGFLQALIEQSRLPRGFLGRIMLGMMNRAHGEMTRWGLCQLDPGSRALEVGCGAGNALLILDGMGLYQRIDGVDPSSEAVRLALRANRQGVEAGRVRLQQAAVPSLPYQDNTFDAVTTFQSHYH